MPNLDAYVGRKPHPPCFCIPQLTIIYDYGGDDDESTQLPPTSSMSRAHPNLPAQPAASYLIIWHSALLKASEEK